MASTEKIERKEWKIGDEAIFYFVDDKHNKVLKEILPDHKQFTGDFPLDFAVRSMLFPFAALIHDVGYGGLTQEEYTKVGKLIKRSNNDASFMFINTLTLDKLVQRAKEVNDLPLLTPKQFNGETVYFPTGVYVKGNSR